MQMLKLLHISNLVSEIENQLESELETSERTRRKRDTVDRITDVIQDIQEALDNLEEEFREERVLHNNRTRKISGEKIAEKCFIEANFKVNCSDIIVDDHRAVKESRQQIDLLIKVLKNKINYLKDLKKALRDNRGSTLSNQDENDSENLSAQSGGATIENSSIDAELSGRRQKGKKAVGSDYWRYCNQLILVRRKSGPGTTHADHQKYQGSTKDTVAQSSYSKPPKFEYITQWTCDLLHVQGL